MTGQKKTGDKPPASDGTTYEVSIAIDVAAAADEEIETIAWHPLGTITTKGGAPTARRQWANGMGDRYSGQELRAVPVSNINEGSFDVAIERKLTPKATTPGAP